MLLLVESDPGLRTWISDILSRGGHALTTAEDALGALAAATEGNCVVAVVDVDLAGQDGFQLVQMLARAGQLAMRVIVLLPNGSAIERLRAMRAGAALTLVRPATHAQGQSFPDTLRDAVQTVLAS